MTDEPNNIVVQIARYGLPLVVLVFYVTASFGFAYTPDSTYTLLLDVREFTRGMAQPSASGTTSPLWLALLEVGKLAGLDILLVAKILGLVLTSFMLMVGYLLAYEIIRDRLLSLLSTIVLASQAWLLQLAPTGSTLIPALALTMVALFFLMRNEYLLGALTAGLATLVFWQAVILFAILLLDIVGNSVSRQSVGGTIGKLVLVFCSVLLPWIGYAILAGVPVVPTLMPFGTLMTLQWVLIAGVALQSVAAIWGVFGVRRSGSENKLLFRAHGALWLWVASGVAMAASSHSETAVLVLPLITIYGFFGLREIMRGASRGRFALTLAVFFAGVLLLPNQVAFTKIKRDLMEPTVAETQQLESIGLWLSVNTPEGSTVASNRWSTLSYYAVRSVGPLDASRPASAEYLVTTTTPSGYEVVFNSTGLAVGDGSGTGRGYSVWKRKQQ